MLRRTIVSAPGKVLITGGYLVLDPIYTGTVIATSARFYCVLTTQASIPANTIVVKSPQFLDALWTYDIRHASDQIQVEPSAGDRNKFVEIALRETFKVAQALVGVESVRKCLRDDSGAEMGLEVMIVGDNDFYSQRRSLEALGLSLTSANYQGLPRFNHLQTKIGDVHKTGLGSSAALITSLVSSLLLHLSVVTKESLANSSRVIEGDLGRALHDVDLIHNASQYIHCLAQGKIGSGFDVASAVYGSQTYKRFNDTVLRPIMSEGKIPSPDELCESICNYSAWTNEVRPVKLPPRIRLALGDVDAGSDTPSLVGKVLEWRRKRPEEAEKLWTRLHRDNTKAAFLLQELGRKASADMKAYDVGLDLYLKGEPMPSALSSETFQLLLELEDTMKAIRQGMKSTGSSAKVPVEPDQQTELLDQSCQIPGVIGGGVPGAGGFDAIYLLIVDLPSANVLERVQSLWASYTEISVSPLSCVADNGGLQHHSTLADVAGLSETLSP